ncbi:endopeptidase La [Clostridium sp. MSJ-8]|uniref:endopeptidase La n=1 Tax=Clostridium sp. MSJ-8 TaxID=2841510 RepID=UPI001C0EA622|nr:endopeptidase La [Clostridium sp. MSJ-8]MBU5487494.1 endopeptidase La [Clostridium sp. MSJ-8]
MNKYKKLPLIPLRGLTIFPNMVIHFDVGRDKSIAAVNDALINNQYIFVAAQKDPEVESPKCEDICEVGTICLIKQILKLSENSMRVLVEGKSRARIKDYLENDEFFLTKVQIIDDEDIEDSVEIEAYFNELKEQFIAFIEASGEVNPEIKNNIESENDIKTFVNMVCGYIPLDESKRQELLETLDIKKRIEMLLVEIQNGIEVLNVQKKIAQKMKKKIDDSQKEFYLKEQLKVIQEELGQDDEDTRVVKEYEEKVSKLKAPVEVKNKVNYELNRLKSMSVSSSEGNTVQAYLDWVLSIPWSKNTKDVLDINKAREVLDQDHYGLDDVKKRIIEYLAAKKYSGSSKGTILCLVGPPGVGKSSIAKSIARSINRKYVRISLGGIKDESELRGHRRTYVAAVPGRFIYSLKEAKVMNPLILLDEIDKLGGDYKGNPADALLEILDAEQNNEFRDNYIELPVDLSKVMFITTANTLETVPRPLLDRMEIIEVSGYTYEEKFQIAKKHLIPKLFKEYKIDKDKFKISNEAIKLIIDGYTRESGVRSLERVIETIIRKSITEMLENDKKTINVNVKKVEELLGARRFTVDESDNLDKVGVVTGLAWTAYGGDTLPIEAVAMEGTGKLQLTGKLGDVMQESAKTAYSYVRAHAKEYNIEGSFYKNKDIHIHVPEGAVPKDGPSAGVTMVTALVSALSGRKVKGNIAMTGEVTLTGKVLPIGGLKEKSLAAYRAGIKTIIIPNDNKKDIEDIPKSIRNKINIIEASDVSVVIKNAMCGGEALDNKK